MFSYPIGKNDLTICSAETADVFPNIQKFFNAPDYSFLATLRAMLPKRMAPTDMLYFGLHYHKLDTAYFEKSSTTKKKAIQELLHHSLLKKNCLMLIDLTGSDKRVMDLVRTKASQVFPLLKLLPDVSYYLSQKGCQKLALVSETIRVTVVIGESLKIEDWHYVQSAIPRLLPWYFTDPLTADDSVILHALTKETHQEYVTVPERIALNIDLRAIKIKKLLLGLEREFMQDRINETECKVQSLSEEIEKMNQIISQKISEKLETQIMLFGLQNMTEPESALVDFFTLNKSLHIAKAGAGVIEYIATGYLNSYDQHILDRFLNNEKSFMYNHHPNAQITTDETVELLRAIFSPTPKCKFRVYTAFELRLDGSLFPMKNYDFPLWLNTYFPHPHINALGCLGGNRQYINSAMADQDYITAITQTMAALRNINFADGAVAPKFIQKLRTDNPLCIEMCTGEIVRPSEAVKLLANIEGRS